MEKLSWKKTVGAIISGIWLYTLAGIAENICDLAEMAQNMHSLADAIFKGSKSSGVSEIEIIGYWCMALVVFGYIRFLTSVFDFSKLQKSESDKENAVRIKQAYIWMIVAVVISCLPIPFVGKLLVFICLLVAYVKLLKAYKRLSVSPTWTARARRGASLLHTAVIWVLVAAIIGLIPLIGDLIESIINFILFFVVLNGWKHIKEGDPDGDLDEDDYENFNRIQLQTSSVSYYEKIARKYDIEQLKNVVANANMYDQKLVAACNAELQIRQNVDGFREMLSTKSDYELNEMLTNPSLYNPAMIFCCEQIMNERNKAYEEEQEKARKAQEEKQKKALEEERKRKEEARKLFWQKYRILIIIMSIIAVLCVVASVGYLHQQKQEEIRMEQERKDAIAKARLAEQQRIDAELQRLEKEREEKEIQRLAKQKAEKERLRLEAERQQQEIEKRERIAFEKQQQDAERERQEVERKVAERKAAGYYKVGELYEKGNLKGIVFDINGPHGKIILLKQVTGTYFSVAEMGRKEFGGKLPSSVDYYLIFENIEKVNAGLNKEGGDIVTKNAYWIDEKNENMAYWISKDRGKGKDMTNVEHLAFFVASY